MSRFKKRHKKHRAKQRATISKRRKNNEAPVLVRDPLSTISPDVLRNHFIEYARESEDRFKEYLSEIQGILRQVDPLNLLSLLAQYGLSGSVSEHGEISSWNSANGFGQANVELVQALALRLAPEELGTGLTSPDIVQRCFNNLPKLSEAFSARRMAIFERERSEQQKSVTMLQEHLRQHTQTVRNWGYADTVKRILGGLATSLDRDFENHLAASATQIIKVFQYLLERSENQGNIWYRKLKQVFEEKIIEKMVRTYNETFECDRCDEAEFIEELKQNNVSINQLKYLLMSHSDLQMHKIFTFSSAEISEQLNIPDDTVKWILQKISLPLGSLSDKQPDHFFLDNPIWTKPVIRLCDESYFCALPMVLFGFSFHILNDIAADNSQLKYSYHIGKAKFLEEEIGKLFRTAFPGCEIVPSYTWVDGGKVFENDLLVRIDSHLFIIEAKSHSVSWPALRGAPDRVRRHIQETILEPSAQSWHLADRLREVLVNPELQEKLLPNFPLPLEGVHTVLRLSVTLEDFAVVQTNQHLFDGTGWVQEGHRLAPCILLADLELVFEMLDSVAQRIHYLRRRAELAKNMDILGDEVDFVGFYLSSGFNIGLAEFEGKRLILKEMSTSVDKYRMARAEGIAGEKPSLRLTEWWKTILHAIEERRFEGWTDMACILLNCSYEEQQKAESMFKHIMKNIHRTYKDPKHLSSVILMPHKHRSDALVLYCFKEAEKEQRYDMMYDLSSQTFKKEHIQRCLVIGINIDRPPHPYSTLTCFFRNDPSTRTDFDVR